MQGIYQLMYPEAKTENIRRWLFCTNQKCCPDFPLCNKLQQKGECTQLEPEEKASLESHLTKEGENAPKH